MSLPPLSFHHINMQGSWQWSRRPSMLAWLLLLTFLLSTDAGYSFHGTETYRRLSGDRYLDRNHAERRLKSFTESFSAAPSPLPLISPPPATPSSRVYHVINYGADPTGTNDSTAAITGAISDAFRTTSTRSLIAGITDLGGAEIHLDSGTYLISSPLTLPASGGGNLKIHSGSLRASDDFPTDRYLIELWAHPQSGNVSRGTEGIYVYEYITIRDFLLDSNFRGGGIAVVNSLRTTIDNCYIVHFSTDGIWVSSGHETYIHNSYLGQHITAGADSRERNFGGTGINLAGNDNAVTDVVVFSAAVGIMVSGQANLLTGVHCYNKATGWGGVGIYLKLPGLTQTRIVNCYLDYTGIVSEDPDQLHISGSFFLGSGNIVLKSVKGVARSVEIVDNMFSGSGGVDIVRLDESNGPSFALVDQVYVERNVADGMQVRATTAAAAVKGNGTVWAVDFSSVLLFPDRIGNVQYTVWCKGDGIYPSTVLRNVSDNRVVIQSEVAAKATVYVTVDQSVGSMV